mmetsp:Transcript_70788/g.166100  ORF Transcript_70788/g.166100 Transcript_70788/m.166100 type:complete len:441 (-) Transcript_70788:118-1440(-)
MGSEAEVYKQRGNDAFKKGDWDLAIKEYNKAINLDPKQASFYSNRAACWSSKGNHESALADANRCLDADPAFIRGYSRKAKALFDLQRWDEAEAAYKEGLAVDPNNPGCATGLAELKAQRNSSQGSGFNFGNISASASGWLQKLKQAGIGGRLQMYMLAFAGYYVYKNFMGPQSVGEKTSHSEAEAEDAGAAASTSSASAFSVPLRRSFSEVSGNWYSYLETGSALSSIVLLHRTGSSAEVEFGDIFTQATKEGATFSVFAPDRPCHGYSPCDSSGSAGSTWLQSLLKRRQLPRPAYVASGLEATRIIFSVVRDRKEAASVLLLSPHAQIEGPGKSDVMRWLARQDRQEALPRSPMSLADAARWAALDGVEAAADLDVKDLPEGCSVSILTEATQTEDKGFVEELESQGHLVRSRQLAVEDSWHDEVTAEVAQLLSAPDP